MSNLQRETDAEGYVNEDLDLFTPHDLLCVSKQIASGMVSDVQLRLDSHFLNIHALSIFGSALYFASSLMLWTPKNDIQFLYLQRFLLPYSDKNHDLIVPVCSLLSYS